MNNLPDSIYLNISDDGFFEEDNDFNDLSDVTWSKDKIFLDDVKYVRDDLVGEMVRAAYRKGIKEGVDNHEKCIMERLEKAARK